MNDHHDDYGEILTFSLPKQPDRETTADDIVPVLREAYSAIARLQKICFKNREGIHQIGEAVHLLIETQAKLTTALNEMPKLIKQDREAIAELQQAVRAQQTVNNQITELLQSLLPG